MDIPPVQSVPSAQTSTQVTTGVQDNGHHPHEQREHGIGGVTHESKGQRTPTPPATEQTQAVRRGQVAINDSLTEESGIKPHHHQDRHKELQVADKQQNGSPPNDWNNDAQSGWEASSGYQRQEESKLWDKQTQAAVSPDQPEMAKLLLQEIL